MSTLLDDGEVAVAKHAAFLVAARHVVQPGHLALQLRLDAHVRRRPAPPPRRVTPAQGGYIFYAGASLAGAGYCRQCRHLYFYVLGLSVMSLSICVRYKTLYIIGGQHDGLCPFWQPARSIFTVLLCHVCFFEQINSLSLSLTTPTAAGLPGLCENFRPTTSKSSPI